MASRDVTINCTPDNPSGRTRHVPDAIVDSWVRGVHAGLPNNEDKDSRTALNHLISWMAKPTYTPNVFNTLKSVAARYQVPHSVVDDMRLDLPDIMREFLTVSLSDHPAAFPGVTSYVRWVERVGSKEEEPRCFREWCFYGTRTNLFRFLGRIAKEKYNAPQEAFRTREAGQKARRRMVIDGRLVEYLRLERQTDGSEIWCHRQLHPLGQKPPNSVPSTARRFLTQPHAEANPKFLLRSEHFESELLLLEQLRSANGILEVRELGRNSNPAIMRWVFEHLLNPFPLLSTTLDAVFAANARFRQVDPELVQRQTSQIDDFGLLRIENQENDEYN